MRTHVSSREGEVFVIRELFTRAELTLFAKAVGSDLRIDILQWVASHPGVSLMELSEKFEVSRAAITQNTKILSEAGLLDIRPVTGNSARKGCYLMENRFLLDFHHQFLTQKIYTAEIPIGQYSDYAITPTCGIATTEEIIGKVDVPAYFDDPKRFRAAVLWFTTGYVEYRLPNYLQKGQQLAELQFSFEIASEAPGSAEIWPSDLTFSLNGQELGSWTSPGDFGTVRGRYTPTWWELNWNQYGLLKLLNVNEHGTYMDGRMISPLTVSDLHIDHTSELRFRIAAPADATNAGGCTLYGKNFGNYNQDLKFNLIYVDSVS